MLITPVFILSDSSFRKVLLFFNISAYRNLLFWYSCTFLKTSLHNFVRNLQIHCRLLQLINHMLLVLINYWGNQILVLSTFINFSWVIVKLNSFTSYNFKILVYSFLFKSTLSVLLEILVLKFFKYFLPFFSNFL